MAWVENNESLSVDERLSALIPQLEILMIENGDKPLPDHFRRRVLERVTWADQMAKDPYTRQAAMSTAGWLLRQTQLVRPREGVVHVG